MRTARGCDCPSSWESTPHAAFRASITSVRTPIPLLAAHSHVAPWFTDTPTVDAVRSELIHSSEEDGFAVLAYCFMPDHVHLLLEGTSPTSDLPRLIARWKQKTGYAHRCATGADSVAGRLFRSRPPAGGGPPRTREIHHRESNPCGAGPRREGVPVLGIRRMHPRRDDRNAFRFSGFWPRGRRAQALACADAWFSPGAEAPALRLPTA